MRGVLKVYLSFFLLFIFLISALHTAAVQFPAQLNSIVSELSWPSKLKLWDAYNPHLVNPNNTTIDMRSLMFPAGQPKRNRRLIEPDISLDRKEGMEAVRRDDPHSTGVDGNRRQHEIAVPQDVGKVEMPSVDDDNNMKLKLFRLMYETVRDSDLKVKRAELIKGQYLNSSSFEVGYLLGDVTDKYNVMTDIAMTLKRLYDDWKPLEHINAYEQIANQAIEIGHLVDLAKTKTKRKETVWK